MHKNSGISSKHYKGHMVRSQTALLPKKHSAIQDQAISLVYDEKSLFHFDICMINFEEKQCYLKEKKWKLQSSITNTTGFFPFMN